MGNSCRKCAIWVDEPIETSQKGHEDRRQKNKFRAKNMVKGNSVAFELDNVVQIPNDQAEEFEQEIIKEALLNNSFLWELAKSISL